MKTPEGKTDSYRAECYGIFGGLWSLQKLATHSEVSYEGLDISVAVGCDNVSAIEQSFDYSKYPDIRGTDSDYDILRAIRTITPQKIKIAWRHVKGHQKGDLLDIWGTLNARADKIAGLCQDNSQMRPPPSTIALMNENWQVLVNNQKLHKHIKTSLYNHISEQIVVPYWQRKERFFPAGSKDINWDALGKAMQQSSTQQRQWITKRAARECGANHVLYKRKAKSTDQCPLCQQVETVPHVLMCQDTRAQQQWESSIDELKRWMKSKDTDPSIITELCDGLNTWRIYGNIPVEITDNFGTSQHAIGWNGVVEGIFSTQWELRQHSYFQEKAYRRSGFKWQVELCKRIWRIPWDMWQHRNSVEHANDQQKILHQLNGDIQDELTRGNDNDPDIDGFLQEAAQPHFQDRTLAFQKRWLKGIRALRARKQRRGLEDHVMNNMRRIMRNFVSN
jgi:hypothetical protein